MQQSIGKYTKTPKYVCIHQSSSAYTTKASIYTPKHQNITYYIMHQSINIYLCTTN
jgi:hypothetical protein